MGRILRVGLASILGCLMAAVPVSANLYKVETPDTSGLNTNVGGYVINVDNDTTADPGTNPMGDATTVACETASRTLIASAYPGAEAPDQDPQRSEFDAMRVTPACMEMRDVLLDQVFQKTGAPPPLSGCHMVNGRLNCYAFQTADCDLFLMLYGNMVRICVGGVSPYN